MATPTNAAPGARSHPPAPNLQSHPAERRAWFIDEIVVAAFAFLGFGGAVLLPLRFGFSKVPPVVASFLLATGLAALTYKYLGGIQGASFAVGTLKLGGALGALVGIALLINSNLVSQVEPPSPYQVWLVTGRVTNDSGQPIEPLDIRDFALEPAQFVPGGNGSFRLRIYSWPASGSGMEFPTLKISHTPFDTHRIDLNPDALNDVRIVRAGNQIEIGQIPLHVPAQNYDPPKEKLKPISSGAAP
jgi:hypothetical protein